MVRLLLGVGFASLTLGFMANAEAGPPSPASPWTKREYVDFYFSHWNGNLALPHLRNAQSRALFDRIVDPENVRFITASATNNDEKLRQITQVLSTMGEIRAAYAYAVMVGEPLSEELTRVQAFTLTVLDAAVRLSGATVDARRKEAWRTTFLGIAEALGDRSRHSGAQNIMLADALAEHYAMVSTALTQADRRAFQGRVGQLVAAEKASDVKKAYGALLRLAEELDP